MTRKYIVFVVLFCFLSGPVAFSLEVSDVLNDGQGDFDPWNETRWADWYNAGKIVETFDIDCSLTFVSRGTDWTPDLTELSSGILFSITNHQGIEIDGNGVVIDGRKPDYRNRTLDQVYSGGIDEWNNTVGLSQCFYFEQPLDEGTPPTSIHNLTLKGFTQGIRTISRPGHPLIIEDCVFTRNSFGTYFSGTNTTVTNCQYLENAYGGFYSGSNSRENNIISNIFRDNNYTINNFSYADMVFDTAYGTLIEDNNHLPSEASSEHFRVALSFYRNMGEDDNIREDAPHDNTIRNNTVDGYSVAFNVGSRMGRSSNDASREGRDHAFDNTFTNNTIQNTDIGFKINTPGNKIESNTLINVDEPIVLHCVFYNLIETIINDQAFDEVRFWFTKSDYSSYQSWFPYQDDFNGSIGESEKFIHVRSDYSAPIFPSPGSAAFVNAPTLLIGNDSAVADFGADRKVNMEDFAVLASYWQATDCNEPNFCDGADFFEPDGAVDANDLDYFCRHWLADIDMNDAYSTGGTPIDIAVGDFYENSPGDEVAVIWDEPVSNISGTDYYSIIIYNSRGIEIDRSGRSTVRWGAIAAGDFMYKPGEEIAAVHSVPIGDKYPVYIFRRGYKDPHYTLMSDNTSKIQSIAAGNFKTDGDVYDEVAVVFEDGPTDIVYCKPTDAGWTNTTQNLPVRLFDIAAGDFDDNVANGDEVAGIGYGYSSSGMVACWDFDDSNGGPLVDKATDGFIDDDLSVIGSVTIADGKATIEASSAGALRALDSADLDLSDAFTIWVRAKVLDEPNNYISLVDKRRFTGPEERAYGFFINEPNVSPEIYIASESFEFTAGELGFTTNLVSGDITSNVTILDGAVFTTDNNNDYYAVVPVMPISISNPAFIGCDGNNYVTAEDTSKDGMPNECILTLNPVDVSSYSNIKVKILVSANPGYFETDDFVIVDYQSGDSGPNTILAAFRGDGFGNLAEDTDLNGTGDGTTLTTEFQEFTFDVNESANSIQVRVRVDVDDSEEVGFDNIRIVSSLNGSSFFGVGGQVSEDGDNGSNSISAHPYDSKIVVAGAYRELAMRSTSTGDIELAWFVSTVENPNSQSQWQLINGPASNPNVESIFDSSVDLYIGNTFDVIANSSTIEYDEVRIYNKSLTLEEIADIEPGGPNVLPLSEYPIYFFRPGYTGYYEIAAPNWPSFWTAIGAGDFDRTGTRDEVAVADIASDAGIYGIKYFVAGGDSPFKVSGQDVLGVPACSLDGGNLTVGATLSDYERANGFTSPDYGVEIAGWGDHAVILPSASQTTSIPLFWLNTNPADANEEHLRVTPLFR